ncbi:hypothetical protein Pse7429DRAFT_4452 [Pseudanabaena biceps PCC 7429]|uniref:Uncharacterized protein n=1 Tax=Pseudanabaena biceps PCC 7429 TaxID=927668 RepID=L8MR03_9CYAN|nr:hypothetical protein Pse7429DRAFT_4452 [Pseudanabaena biceps PCC 7429]
MQQDRRGKSLLIKKMMLAAQSPNKKQGMATRRATIPCFLLAFCLLFAWVLARANLHLFHQLTKAIAIQTITEWMSDQSRGAVI